MKNMELPPPKNTFKKKGKKKRIIDNWLSHYNSSRRGSVLVKGKSIF